MQARQAPLGDAVCTTLSTQQIRTKAALCLSVRGIPTTRRMVLSSIDRSTDNTQTLQVYLLRLEATVVDALVKSP